jgi:hypothetical protein
MAEEVFMSEGKLYARGAGSTGGVPTTALAGGDELFFSEITGNFASTSTSFIDITGLTGTMTVPDGPYIVELYTPVASSGAGANSTVQLVTGSTVLVSDTFKAPAANDGAGLYMRQRFPSSMHTAAPGTQVTYKAQLKSAFTTSTATVFVDFAGRINPAFIRAYRT